MKRLLMFSLSLFVVSALIFPCFSASTLPDVFSLCDLSDVGISAMKAEICQSAPQQDGQISAGEYGDGSVTDFSTGLNICSFDGGETTEQQKNKISSSVFQESFVSFDDHFIYPAIRATLSEGDLSSFENKKLGQVYVLSLSLGLTPGDHPAERCSSWSNTYYFSAKTLQCVGVNGERVARSVEEASGFTLCISTINDMYRENGYQAPDGTFWSAETYCRQVAFSIEEKAGKTVVTAEAKIPLGDALLSVTSSQRDKIAEQLKNKSGVLCGSFSTKLSFSSDGTSLVTGLSSRGICPFFDGNKTWKTVMKENFAVPKSGIFLPEVIPVPLYWLGEPSARGEEATTDLSTSDFIEMKAGSVKTFLVEEKTLVSEEENNGAAFGDESVFDSLPDEWDLLPEETEIIYTEGEEETAEEKKEDGSLLGSILTFAAGILLFATVVILCFFYRARDEREEGGKDESKKAKKSKKKK